MILKNLLAKFFICFIFLSSIFNQTVLAYWHETSLDMMGTKFEIKIESLSKQQASVCSEQAYQEIDRIEQLLSSFIPTSEISQINLLAPHEAVAISDETFFIIEQAIQHSKNSQGAFDITFASIGYQYDLRKKIKPTEQQIKQYLDAIDYRHIVLKYPTIAFKHQNVKINLGGIAKGYAIEQASKLLKQCGILEGIISGGGDSKIIGDHHGKEWIIGIQHPRKEKELALRIPLSNIAISTSGDYERYYLDNGQRIHHILNPKTGKPTTQTWSASVIGNNATKTDVLSTTIFILGKTKGLELINSLQEFDAIIIDSKGKIHYSNGLNAYAQR